jgi:hypothetical protein
MSNPTPVQEVKSFSVRVPANIYWYNTDIAVEQGNQLEFTATGQWYSGIGWTDPEGDSEEQCGKYPVPCGNLGALVGKVGENGAPFRIGSSFTEDATASGNLFLAMNENTGACTQAGKGSCYLDNEGELTVTVIVRTVQ